MNNDFVRNILELRVVLFIFIVSSFYVHNAFCQEECGTIAIPDPDFDLIEYQEFIRDYTPGREIIELPIQPHIVRLSFGGGGLNETALYDALDQVNAHYLPMDIQFFFCDVVHYIDDNLLYNYDRNVYQDLLISNNVSDVINVYFVNKIIDDDNTFCGYASFPWRTEEYVIVKNSCAENGSTFSHELGHYFGLYHTHSTSEGIELVDGSNCSFRGDLICDTPADPRLGSGNVNSNCEYDGNERDPNNDPYDPDPGNIMSYAPKVCRDSFSEGQFQRIAYYYENERNYLQCNTVSAKDAEFAQNVRVYPNPARDLLNYTSDISSDSHTEIHVVDIFGRIHLEKNIFGANGNFKLEGLPEGIYLFCLKYADQHMILPFLKL
jgi:hypothetical protein